MEESRSSGRGEGNLWAEGLVLFAAGLLCAGGIFQFLAGLAAIIDDEFFAVVDGYAYYMDVTVWGWIHLVLGIVLVLTGIALFRNIFYARFIAMMFVILAAVANFLYIPYQPVWSIILLAINGAVLWALITAPVRSSDEY